MPTFHSNCTRPPGGVTFVAAPDIRGTLGIVWSCSSILLICTWSILHMNVPLQSTLSLDSTKQKYLRATIRFVDKMKWMLINVLAPEWPLGKAWSDYRSVKSAEERFDAWRRKDGVPWSAAHIYFANMGGFAIKFSPAHSDPVAQSSPTMVEGVSVSIDAEVRDHPNNECRLNRSMSAPPTLAHVAQSSTAIVNPLREPINVLPQAALEKYSGTDRDCDLPDSVREDLDLFLVRGYFSAQAIQKSMAINSRNIGEVDWHVDETNSALVAQASRTVHLGHFRDRSERKQFLRSYWHWFANIHALQGDLWILDANQLLLARELGIIGKLPAVADDDVGDRNKGDLLVKVVALGQIGWFVLQLITRLYERFPTSQLEIMTLAFAVCTGITYLLLMDKPKDAGYSIIIPAARHPRSPEELIRLAFLGPRSILAFRRVIEIPNNAIHLNTGDFRSVRLSQLALSSAFAALIFGSVQCIAWNFVFATEVERVLWQASSIITTVAFPAGVVIGSSMITIVSMLQRRGDRTFSPILRVTSIFVYYTFGALYIAARAFILFEVFRSLAFLPPEAFLTSWPANLPHIT